MPFGLSTAPRVCTQLLSVVHFALSEQGITSIRYLDDFFLIAKSEKDMARDLPLAQSLSSASLSTRRKRKGRLNGCPFSGSYWTRSIRPCPALPSAWRS